MTLAVSSARRSTAKPYKYKVPRVRGGVSHDSINRPKKLVEDEGLTGVVNGEAATDIEERFARALWKNKRVEGFDFQNSYFAGRNMAGEVRPDFIVYAGTAFPVQVDGEFAHRTAEQKASDRAKDAMLDGLLTPMGAAPTQRISGELLQTQDDADRLVEELF